LNDISGFHVKKEHVFEAMNSASAGPVGEGNVGGGTVMFVHQFKGGIGTASRKLENGIPWVHRCKPIMAHASNLQLLDASRAGNA